MDKILPWSAILICAFATLPPALSYKPKHADAQRSISRTGISKDLKDLLADLRKGGAITKLSAENISQPFFSAPGRVIYVNDQSVWIFQYRSMSAADKDAAKISSDGMTIGMSKPSWLGTPHFYRRSRMIVLYLGDESRVIDVLRRTLGQQFAGG